ncbi:hypothetical protein Pst134EA_031289 [Puccinia striiformis f. sp. tritici]|uniref:uncharacterized protein n=1 Tax=Puccinia striiformis f. sp. tritici TaxID=168172 RepID=UPI0020081DB0|nr:uncharacterized protein Pst134EA_031289 [Puccinia striiformis f. sp. tritici]KAH9443387.1 hypothetical protein Pst134EA_031289 [Puccinia striiformis f. sp. tritici]
MCSAQIESLAKAHEEVASSLFNISCNLTWEPVQAGWNQEAMSYTAFIEWAENLKTSFEAPLILALLHLIPSIPDTDGFSDSELLQELVQDLEDSTYLSYRKFHQFCQICGQRYGIACLIPA